MPSVALPTLATDLHANTGQLQWFIDSYNLVPAAVLLPAGLLGDRFGRKRLLIAGLALFGTASAWWAYAGSADGLIAARVLLAIGAAFLLTLPASVLPSLFGPGERSLLAAAVLVLGFVGWQRRVQARALPGERLLIDLSVFRSPRFTWGLVLAVTATFAMFGMLLASPQYFQTVLGYSALGSGLRQLPMIGGLLVGSRLGGRITACWGAKATVGTGLSLMAAGLLLGATTSLGDGFGLAASWMTIFGLGLGLTLPAAMDAAIGSMPAERAGMGSGLLMSLRMVGGAIGVAVLGSLVNSVYRGDLDVRALSPASAAGVRDADPAGQSIGGSGESRGDAVRTA